MLTLTSRNNFHENKLVLPRSYVKIQNSISNAFAGSPGMSPESSFDTTFDTSFGSDISASTPIQGPRIQTDKVRKRLLTSAREDADTSLTKVLCFLLCLFGCK